MTVSLAVTAALTAANMALNASRKIEGPRLDDLKVTVADYGTPLNYFHGARRFEGVPIIWADPIREQKRRRKTKGGKYSDYTYFGTWAVAVADHAIDGVRRIWFDKHLVYDLTGAGPVTPFALGKSFGLGDHVRVYKGSETQLPDHRMLASVEAEQGAGSCPAYRGVSYVVFEEIPLEKLGNRIPQVTVEAVRTGAPSYPFEVHEVAESLLNRLWGFAYSPDGSRMVWGQGDRYEIWDVAARSLMISGQLPVPAGGAQTVIGLANDGRIHLVYNGIGPGSVRVFSADGLSYLGETVLTAYAESCQVLADPNGNEYCLLVALSGLGDYVQYFPLGAGESSLITVGFAPRMYLNDVDGGIWAVGGPLDSDKVGFYCLAGPRAGTQRLITSPGGTHAGASGALAVHNGAGAFVVSDNGKLFLVDDEDFTVGTTRTGLGSAFTLPKQFINCPPGAGSIWIGASEVSLTTLETLRTVDFAAWVGAGEASASIYDPVNHALITAPFFDSTFAFRFLDRLGVAAVTLATIANDVAERCGMAVGARDFSAFDQPIRGTSWTQGSGKDVLEPLFDLHDCDVRPHGFQLQGVKRGGAAAATIDSAAFARSGDEPAFQVRRSGDSDLPRRLTLKFADVDADQQVNSAPAARPLDAVDGVRELVIDMGTTAMAPSEAKQLAERMLRRTWFGAETYELGLTRQRLGLEPADLGTLGLSGVARSARLVSASVGGDGVVRCRWERDDPAIARLSGSAGAGQDGRVPQTILVPLLSKGFLLDIPLLRDADNSVNPLLYHGAGPYGAGSWPGAVIFQGDGAAYEIEHASVAPPDAVAWGHASDALAAASPAVWDRGGSVNVVLKNGEIVSVGEAACDALPTANLALLGSELIQFATATLETDGSYTLRGLKRGRRGTEWAIAGHVAGEAFILMDRVTAQDMGLSDIGTTLHFKAVTVGRDEASAFPIAVPFEGASLRPYAPAHLRATHDAASGDWALRWVRRSRIGGAWTGGSTIPLGEASEAYSLVIMAGAVEKRVIAAATPEAVYSAADQVADFGGLVTPGSLDVMLYQISAAVGRGQAASGGF